MNNQSAKFINENQIIMLDTCFAMSEGFTDFIDGIEEELLVRNKRIIVKCIVMAELYRLMGSKDQNVKERATRAVDYICLRRHIFEIDDEKITTEAILKGFADVEFLIEFTKSRIEHRMALLTNDYKLGKDINELNNLESCYGKKVSVFCLNRSGELEERIYEEEPVSSEAKTQDVAPKAEQKEKDKKTWLPIILSSATCFVAGFITDKYGKQIANYVMKAIA